MDYSGSPAACDQINSSSKATCYTNAAQILDNPGVCDSITDQAAKYKCKVQVESIRAARAISKAIDNITGYTTNSTK